MKRLYHAGLYGAVGVELAGSVIVGLAIGHWLDKKIGSAPAFSLLGTILGTGLGIWNIFRILKFKDNGDNKN
jgi:F0F1-type ATP synthase assembly protein I